MSAVAPRQERYFNPRSHEGSDELGLLIAQVAGIFQSSLPRGERPTPKPATTAGSDFNPRSHEGSDYLGSKQIHQIKVISIHAPTRGATFMAPDRNIDTLFQSTLPRGERHNTNDIYRICAEFQSTLPRGERLWQGFTAEYNPIISIHAPTRGATANAYETINRNRISIHAPTRGATFYQYHEPL